MGRWLSVVVTIVFIRVLRDPRTRHLFWKVRGRSGIHRIWPLGEGETE